MEYHNQHSLNGLNNIQPWKQKAEKLLQPRKSKTFKSVQPNLRRKIKYKKSDCHIHATLKQRLDAVYKLQHQYTIKTLCRVLRVNRSTYYKHFYSKPAPRTCENQVIRKHILQIYSDYDNSLGAYKIRRVLEYLKIVSIYLTMLHNCIIKYHKLHQYFFLVRAILYATCILLNKNTAREIFYLGQQ